MPRLDSNAVFVHQSSLKDKHKSYEYENNNKYKKNQKFSKNVRDEKVEAI